MQPSTTSIPRIGNMPTDSPIYLSPTLRVSPYIGRWRCYLYGVGSVRVRERPEVGRGKGLNQHRKHVLGPLYRTIKRVTFDRFAASFADQPHQLTPAEVLAGGGAGVMVDTFLYQRAVQVVCSKTLRNL